MLHCAARRQDRFTGRIVRMMACPALLLGMSVCGVSRATVATPIGLTGWNENVIYASGVGVSQTVTGFDGTYHWYTAGTGLSGNGIPLGTNDGYSNSILSEAPTNPGNTVFQFQPASQNSVLLINQYDTSSTLNLSAPAGYNSLAILSASNNMINQRDTSSFTITFSDNTISNTITYDPFDWSALAGSDTQAVFSTNLNRSESGSMPNTSNGDGAYYQMYETDINLATLGDADKYIKSISFAAPGGGYIGVFAVSGVVNSSASDPQPVPVPEPTALDLLMMGGMIFLGRHLAKRFKQLPTA